MNNQRGNRFNLVIENLLFSTYDSRDQLYVIPMCFNLVIENLLFSTFVFLPFIVANLQVSIS